MADTSTPWQSIRVPDSMRSQRKFPTVMWVNHPWNLEPKPDPQSGGFFAAERHGAAKLPNGVEASYREDEGLFARHLTVAIIALRVRWGRRSEDGRWAAANGADARRRVDVLALIKDGDDFTGPVKFTTVGRVNDPITEQYSLLTTRAQQKEAEPWMFWVEMEAGNLQDASEQFSSQYTPLHVSIPTEDELADAFIGTEAAQRITDLADEIERWKAKYKGDTNASGDDEEPEDVQAVLERDGRVEVTTKKYGRLPISDLIQKDHKYAYRVLNYILEHQDGFAQTQVRAANSYVELQDRIREMYDLHTGADAGQDEAPI